jgi:2-dehydropantoate 2-reductase
MTSSHTPSIAVIGAGGVGGLLAAMLAKGGNDVRMLARGAALAAIRANGLALHGPGADYRVAISRADDDPAALGEADIVLVTVKTWQLAELGPRLAPLVGSRTVVVPLQNGVEASEQLAGSLGGDRVIGGVARLISWIERPGEIRTIGVPAALDIGALHPGQAEAVAACAATLRTGGIDIVVADSIDTARWTKFLFIAPYSAIGAVERIPLGVIRSTPRTRGQLEASLREIAALAAARGVALAANAVEATLAWYDVLPADATASMHRDIVAGRPSELHELIGAVVRLGRESGVPTPVSAELYAQLQPLEAAARAAR